MKYISMLFVTGVLAALLSSNGAAQAHLNTYAYSTGLENGLTIKAEIEGAEGGAFALFASLPGPDGFNPLDAYLLGVGGLDNSGSGSFSRTFFGFDKEPDVDGIELCAVYIEAGDIAFSDKGSVPFTSAEHCDLVDFDFTIGLLEPELGQIIDDEWALMGMNISAVNALPGHPHFAIIFDSGNPTGGDDDLETPGGGAGNDEALGKLLIIPENDTDANGDGYVDNPDDELFGGVMTFAFDFPVDVCAITLVDIDDPNASELHFEFSGGGTDIIGIPNMGNNSVQTITFMKEEVVKLEVHLGGSGAVASVEVEPCPDILNFDDDSVGAPLEGMDTGVEITDQFLGTFGLLIHANNAVVGHPDKCILFDSANPTGGDDDLQTPGYGLDNDIPLGKILIIAEDDVDADDDGLVDDPDDEEGGGIIFFDFETDQTWFGATVLDVDGSEKDFFLFFDENDNVVATIDLINLGDNSVQATVFDPPVENVRRVELHLGGSGAVTRLRFCPEDEDDEV